ncbi:MAG: HD domain-containing protein [Candidatus Dojkabacteria bacterium]|nr:HD domain-containing protein [Candidatus Dojkabacteria bacterium]
MDLTLSNIKQDPQVELFIIETDRKLNAMSYTDHGKRHAHVTSDRAMMIARKAGFDEKEIEYSGIAGYCHDMGNFLDRNQHHYWASLLFHQVFNSQTDDYEGLTSIIQAIANHDKDEARLTNNISAALILADKSDVHRDRVKEKDKSKILSSIHDRVNYSVTRNDLDVNDTTKVVTLMIQLDDKLTPVMDFFDVFLSRMNYCRKAAEYLGFKFKLVINDFELL